MSSASALAVEQLARVLADRLEHAEALAVGADEALVDERAERVEISAAHLLDRLERAAPDEDGEPAEERLLVVVEELDAPADRVAQRSVPGGGVARARGEELESVLQPSEHRRRGQHLDPRRGELDRERQVVEVAADLGDRVQVGLVRLEVRADRACPLEEQADGGVARERLERELLLAARRAAVCGS